MLKMLAKTKKSLKNSLAVIMTLIFLFSNSLTAVAFVNVPDNVVDDDLAAFDFINQTIPEVREIQFDDITAESLLSEGVKLKASIMDSMAEQEDLAAETAMNYIASVENEISMVAEISEEPLEMDEVIVADEVLKTNEILAVDGFLESDQISMEDEIPESAEILTSDLASLADGFSENELEALGSEASSSNIINVVADYGFVGDGTTADINKFKNAFSEAVATGKTLYFPKGIYNLGNTSVTAEQSITVRGESAGSTKIINAPQINAKKDMDIQNISLSKESGYILYPSPVGLYALTVNNVRFTSPGEHNNKVRYIYTNPVSENGFTNVTVTNCSFEKGTNAIYLAKTIQSGNIENNIIENMGIPGVDASLYGIYLSNEVHNVTIARNYIDGMYTGSASNSTASGIYIMTGSNMTIERNYLGNIIGLPDSGTHYGILFNTDNTKILNNIFYNAGNRMSIYCYYVRNTLETKVVIQGNKVLFDANPHTGGYNGVFGITCYADVLDNYINTTHGMALGFMAQNSDNITARCVNIKRNQLISYGENAIRVQGIDGDFTVASNRIQYEPETIAPEAAILLKIISSGSRLNILENQIYSRKVYSLYFFSINPDVRALIFGNKFNIGECNSDAGAIALDKLIYEFSKNTIKYNKNTGISASNSRSIIKSTPEYGLQWIHNNDFVCDSESSNYLVNVTPQAASAQAAGQDLVKFTDNEFSMLDGSKAEAVFYYATGTTATDLSGKNTDLSRNRIRGTGTVKNFFRVNNNGSQNFGSLNIDQNSGSVTERLIGCYTTNTALGVDKLIISQNTVKSGRAGYEKFIAASNIPAGFDSNEVSPLIFDDVTAESLKAEGDALRASIEESMAAQEVIKSGPLSGDDVINVVTDLGFYTDGRSNNDIFKNAVNNGVITQGKTIYFPDGEYNLGYTEITAETIPYDLKIIGESRERTWIYNAPSLKVQKDIQIENISISMPFIARAFLWLTPVAFNNIYINNVSFTGYGDGNGDRRLPSFMAGTSSLGALEGYEHVQITNSYFANCGAAIKVSFRITGEGIVENNIIENLGDPDIIMNALAIVIGADNDNVDVNCIEDHFTVSHNYIKGLHNKFISYTMGKVNGIDPYESTSRGILTYSSTHPSGNTVIERNYVEDIGRGSAHTGIYARGAGGRVLNNILLNAGQDSIIHKSFNQTLSDRAVIKGNKVISDSNEVTSEGYSYQSGFYTETFSIEVKDNYLKVPYGCGISLGTNGRMTYDSIVDNNQVIAIGPDAHCIAIGYVSGYVSVLQNRISFDTPALYNAAISIADFRKDDNDFEPHLDMLGNKVHTNSSIALTCVVSMYTPYENSFANISGNMFDIVNTEADTIYICLNKVACKFSNNLVNISKNPNAAKADPGKIMGAYPMFGLQEVSENIFITNADCTSNDGTVYSGSIINFVIDGNYHDFSSDEFVKVKGNTFKMPEGSAIRSLVFLNVAKSIDYANKKLDISNNIVEGSGKAKYFFYMYENYTNADNRLSILLDRNDVKVIESLIYFYQSPNYVNSFTITNNTVASESYPNVDADNELIYPRRLIQKPPNVTLSIDGDVSITDNN